MSFDCDLVIRRIVVNCLERLCLTGEGDVSGVVLRPSPWPDSPNNDNFSRPSVENPRDQDVNSFGCQAQASDRLEIEHSVLVLFSTSTTNTNY